MLGVNNQEFHVGYSLWTRSITHTSQILSLSMFFHFTECELGCQRCWIPCKNHTASALQSWIKNWVLPDCESVLLYNIIPQDEVEQRVICTGTSALLHRKSLPPLLPTTPPLEKAVLYHGEKHFKSDTMNPQILGLRLTVPLNPLPLLISLLPPCNIYNKTGPSYQIAHL